MALDANGQVGCAEVYFAKKLANTEKKVRDKSVKRLRLWISSKVKAGKGLEEEDFLKLWKGLFYCMWFSDKPLIQEELADNLSDMIHLFKPHSSQGILFAKIFFVTMGREWHSLDRLRMDKFYMLVKKYISATYLYLSNSEWNEGLTKETSSFLTHLLLSDKFPDSLKMFWSENFLPQLEECCPKGDEFPDSSTLLSLFDPFFQSIAHVKSANVVRSMCTEIMNKIVTLDITKEDENGNISKLQMPLVLFCERLFELMSKKTVQTKNRKRLMLYRKRFSSHLSGETGECEGETKKAKKRKKDASEEKLDYVQTDGVKADAERVLEEIDTTETTADVVTEPVKKKKKKKKKEKKGVESSTVDESADIDELPSVAVENDPCEDESVDQSSSQEQPPRKQEMENKATVENEQEISEVKADTTTELGTSDVIPEAPVPSKASPKTIASNETQELLVIEAETLATDAATADTDLPVSVTTSGNNAGEEQEYSDMATVNQVEPEAEEVSAQKAIVIDDNSEVVSTSLNDEGNPVDSHVRSSLGARILNVLNIDEGIMVSDDNESVAELNMVTDSSCQGGEITQDDLLSASEVEDTTADSADDIMFKVEPVVPVVIDLISSDEAEVNSPSPQVVVADELVTDKAPSEGVEMVSPTETFVEVDAYIPDQSDSIIIHDTIEKSAVPESTPETDIPVAEEKCLEMTEEIILQAKEETTENSSEEKSEVTIQEGFVKESEISTGEETEGTLQEEETINSVKQPDNSKMDDTLAPVEVETILVPEKKKKKRKSVAASKKDTSEVREDSSTENSAAEAEVTTQKETIVESIEESENSTGAKTEGTVQEEAIVESVKVSEISEIEEAEATVGEETSIETIQEPEKHEETEETLREEAILVPEKKKKKKRKSKVANKEGTSEGKEDSSTADSTAEETEMTVQEETTVEPIKEPENSKSEETEEAVQEEAIVVPEKKKKKRRKSMAASKEDTSEVKEDSATENSTAEETELTVSEEIIGESIMEPENSKNEEREETVQGETIIVPEKKKKKRRKSVAASKEDTSEVKEDSATENSTSEETELTVSEEIIRESIMEPANSNKEETEETVQEEAITLPEKKKKKRRKSVAASKEDTSEVKEESATENSTAEETEMTVQEETVVEPIKEPENSRNEEVEEKMQEEAIVVPEKKKKKRRKSVAASKEDISEVKEDSATENSTAEETEMTVSEEIIGEPITEPENSKNEETEETVEEEAIPLPEKKKKKRRKSVAASKEDTSEVKEESTNENSAAEEIDVTVQEETMVESIMEHENSKNEKTETTLQEAIVEPVKKKKKSRKSDASKEEAFEANEGRTENLIGGETDQVTKEKTNVEPVKEKKKKRKSIAVSKEDTPDVKDENGMNLVTDETRVPVPENPSSEPIVQEKRRRKSALDIIDQLPALNRTEPETESTIQEPVAVLSAEENKRKRKKSRALHDAVPSTEDTVATSECTAPSESTTATSTAVEDEEHEKALKQKPNRRKSFNTKQKALSQKMEDMLQSYGLIDDDEVDAQEDWGGQSDWLTPQIPCAKKMITEDEKVPQTEPSRNEKKKTKKGKKKKSDATTVDVAVEENVCDETVADFSKFVENVKQKLDFTSSDEGPHSDKESGGSGREELEAEASVDKLFTQLEDVTLKPKSKKKKKGLNEDDEPQPVATFMKTPPQTVTSAFFRKAVGTKTEKIERTKKAKKSVPTPKSEPGNKKVKIELSNNQAVAPKDLFISPNPAFSPTRKPIKSAIKPSSSVKKRSKASDFF